MRKYAIAVAIFGPFTLAGCGAFDLAVGAMQGANMAFDLASSAGPRAEEQSDIPPIKMVGANCRTPRGAEYKTRDRALCDRLNGTWIGPQD